jgi:hypothetical protein
MNSLKTIIIKLKSTVEIIDKRTYTYKDIAHLLNINYVLFVKMARINKIPFQEICDFCYKYKININSLIYNQNNKESVRYFYNLVVSLDTGLTRKL